MLRLATFQHHFSLLVAVVADAIGRVASSAWQAASASTTEQRDRELPVVRYGKPCLGAEQGLAAAAERCAFCLSGIEEGDEVRVLRCRHLFHGGCLDRWLVARPSATCPLCRGELLVPPTCVGGEDEDGGLGVTGMAAFMAYVRHVAT